MNKDGSRSNWVARCGVRRGRGFFGGCVTEAVRDGVVHRGGSFLGRVLVLDINSTNQCLMSLSLVKTYARVNGRNFVNFRSMVLLISYIGCIG